MELLFIPDSFDANILPENDIDTIIVNKANLGLLFFDKRMLYPYKINNLLSINFWLIYFNFFKKTINFFKTYYFI
uniref:Uncharacterized protein n=1 Tax=Arsenophonus nasoniae TaxID=638 RepID=D2U3H5_9GAMM|nr:hypothetical protein ARN_31990 [Arsenophonus nasoniae]